MANSLAGDIGRTSRQRELWEIESRDRQLDAEKTGHAGGKLKCHEPHGGMQINRNGLI